MKRYYPHKYPPNPAFDFKLHFFLSSDTSSIVSLINSDTGTLRVAEIEDIEIKEGCL